MLVFMSHSYKNMPHDAWYKITLYIILFGASLTGLVVSAINSNDVLNCLGMFCTIDSGIATSRPSGTGGGVIGMNLIFFFIALFFMLFFMVLIGLVVIFRNRGIQSAFTHESHEQTPLFTPSEVHNKYNSVNSNNSAISNGRRNALDVNYIRKYVKNHIRIDRNAMLQEFILITAVFTAFFPIIIVACTMLPDWIFYFTKYDIQKFQALHPSDELDIYFTASAADAPIQPKLYLDILVFYAAIYLVAGVALLAMVWESLRRVLHLRLSTHICLGQALLVAVFLALLAGEFCYWYLVHGYESQPRSDRSNAELAARALGQLNNVILGLLTLPVSKNSFWSPLFGVSWEAMVVYHQIMGYAFMLMIAAHMFAWWYVYHEQNSFPADILAVPMTYHGDNFTISIATLTYFIMIPVFGVLTFYSIRRAYYELFYYAHLFSGVVFLVVLWHATMSWYFILPGLALYVLDHAIRMLRNVAAGVVLADVSVALIDTEEPHEDTKVHLAADYQHASKMVNDTHVLRGEPGVVKIAYTIRAPVHSGYIGVPLSHAMGQYCYINIPRISRLEWHPFTISSAPVDIVTTHHIKVMGGYDPESSTQDQWTAKLYALAVEMQQLRTAPRPTPQAQPVVDTRPLRGDAAGSMRVALLAGVTVKDSPEVAPSAASWPVAPAGPRSIVDVLADEELVVNVEGPYGLSIADSLNHKGYTHLLFVGGGIGVTPLHSCLRQLYVTAKACRFAPTKPEPSPADEGGGHDHEADGGGKGGDEREGAGFTFDATKSHEEGKDDYLHEGSLSEDELPAYPYPALQAVKLVWAVKTPTQAGDQNLFSDTFDLIAVDNVKGMFEVAVHVTGHDRVREQAESLGLDKMITAKQELYGGNAAIQLKIGRPQLEEEVKKLEKHKMKALLFVCGPAAMVEDCAQLTMQYGIDFRHETFEL